ncbi:MAG: RNA polymerase sigma factor [Akkermansiaceae bacterium]|nr:RNA polymerase sigma factor [Verrucomicrobiales bacterium]
MNRDDQHECFERWMTDHIAILYRVVNGFAEGSDRNDLMQEVLLAVWKAIPSFRGQAQATTFLYRVSHNAALTWHRTRRNYLKRVEQAEPLAGAESSLPDSTDERLEQLYAAIRRLPELDRSIVLLSLDGLSYQEMAGIHGLSESNVGVRLNRIKQRLAKTLNQKEIYEPR